MDFKKQIVTLSLATVVSVTPLVAFAQEAKMEDRETTKLVAQIKEEYIEFEGNIKSVIKDKDGKISSVLVEKDNKEQKIFHIDESNVDDMKLTFENKMTHIKEGARVIAIYNVNTPEALSMPGQLTPEILIVKNDKNMKLELSYFDENLLNEKKDLSLNIAEDLRDQYKNKHLVIMYSVVAESFPAQTSPNKIIPLKSVDEAIVPKEEGLFAEYRGKIKSAHIDGQKGHIIIELDGEDIRFNFNEESLIRDMTLTRENKIMHLKEGQEVVVFTRSNAPQTSSIPPQIYADAIVAKNGDSFVKFDKFDGNLVSSDNSLKLNVDEAKDYKNKELLVYYKNSTKSIPAITTPELIVIKEAVDSKDDKQIHDISGKITKMDKIMVNGKEVSADIYYDKDDNVMVEMRPMVEALGYKINWTSNSKPMDIVSGADFTSITIGKNSYTVARMAAFELEKAPVLSDDGRTFVPVKFFGDVIARDHKTSVVEGVLQLNK